MNHDYFQATNDCINWCKTQTELHYNNITTGNLFVIAIAMGALLLHNLLWYHDDWLIENTDITRSQVKIIYVASSYFAFILLAIFIIYYTVFQ